MNEATLFDRETQAVQNERGESLAKRMESSPHSESHLPELFLRS